VSKVLDRWNQLPPEQAAREVLDCCGSVQWSRVLTARRPLTSEAALIAASDETWSSLPVPDWLEAFSKHPRIGERKAPESASAQSATWSSQEQEKTADAPSAIQSELAARNREYESRFNRVFIICAAGRSADEILEVLHRRLYSDDATELREAAEEQRKITNLRLRRWLQG
jgi:2-oxo-4-hydroxy-4-carboxy-5-ureidoimidazoline decarboxylase